MGLLSVVWDVACWIGRSIVGLTPRCSEGGRHVWDDATFDPWSLLRQCGKCGVAE